MTNSRTDPQVSRRDGVRLAMAECRALLDAMQSANRAARIALATSPILITRAA